MKFIKDLGYIYPTAKSRKKYNYGIFKCPICERDFKILMSDTENHDGNCKYCKLMEGKKK